MITIHITDHHIEEEVIHCGYKITDMDALQHHIQERIYDEAQSDGATQLCVFLQELIRDAYAMGVGVEKYDGVPVIDRIEALSKKYASSSPQENETAVCPTGINSSTRGGTDTCFHCSNCNYRECME